jgi:quercetin dioxygenase-like cupin family protein
MAAVRHEATVFAADRASLAHVREAWRGNDKMSKPPVLRQATEGRTIAVVGDVYRFLATGDDTNGKYAMWEAIVPPGGGPPSHVHSREEEGFYILEGEITLHVGEERIVVTAGMFANMPVGTPHSFKNESSNPARMLISVAPAGLEQMFFEVGVPLAQGATTALPPAKEEIDTMLDVAPKYGIEIKPPNH